VSMEKKCGEERRCDNVQKRRKRRKLCLKGKRTVEKGEIGLGFGPLLKKEENNVAATVA